MKIIKHENKIELVPESEFDKECLKFISSYGPIYAEWTDKREETGNLILQNLYDDWNK